MEKKKKVLFITNVPVPYRMEFFRLLGREVDLTVCFERRIGDYQYNYDYNSIGFNAIFLSDFLNSKQTCEDELCKGYDYVVFCGYSTKLSRQLICFCRKHNISYGFELDGAICKNESCIKQIIKKYLLKKAKFCFSSSDESDKYLERYGISRNKIFRFHFSSVSKNYLEFNKPSTSAKEELGFNKEKTLILFVGRLIHRKGADVLLKSLDGLDSTTEVAFVGGNPTKEYQELIKLHNLRNVKFIDFAPSEVVMKYYDAADIFVLPTREDIWGLVINEAMAHKCAIVTTNQCIAGRELIENGVNGFLIESDDCDSLNSCLRKIVFNSKLMESMKECSFAKIRQYTIEEMVIDHMRLFNNGDKNE